MHTVPKIYLTLVLFGVSLLSLRCSFSDLAVNRFLENAGEYFRMRPGSHFTELRPNVFTYQKDFDRNLIVKTTAGLVIIDPFNPEFAAELAAELQQRFPGVPVHTLIYSHYHLDHVRGGAILQPGQVLGHRHLARYWQFIADPSELQILPVTRSLSGDVQLEIGGVRMQLLDMGLSHTDTLFAVHLPDAGVLFAPDLGFVRAVPPAGMPDMYYFGYIAALERLATLEFDVYVPSHFDTGKRADLIEFIAFMRYARELTDRARRNYGPVAAPSAARHYQAAVYEPLKERYGHWLGFDEMILPLLIRNFAGSYLGY